MFAGFEVVDVVAQDFRMVESERRRWVARIEEANSFRIVGGDRSAARACDVNRRYRLAARVAVGAGIDAEQRANFDLERNLLARLANRGLLNRLAEIDKAARDCVPMRKVLALY